MGLRDRFRRKPKETKTDTENVERITDLEQLCGSDKETYEELLHAMFLDPRKVGMTMDEAAENARKTEKAKDLLKAKVWYEIAGGLAIYEGDAKKTAEFFSAAEKISGMRYPIVKNPEKAVAVAKEFYKKHLTTVPA